MTAATRVCLLWFAWAALDEGVSVEAQPRSTNDTCKAALLRAPGADPLEFARAAARCGDGALLALLQADEVSATRLAAIRASPFLTAPERALPDLVALISGRDSLLAPAAARATLDIAAGLRPSSLAQREVAPQELSPTLGDLKAASENPQLRVELRMMAARAAALLAAAGVPSA